MSKIDLIYLEKRRIIYNYILKNPGLHFRNISRKLKIPKSTIEYHLVYLKKQGLIVENQELGYLRYYASEKIGQKDKKNNKYSKAAGTLQYCFIFTYVS